MRKDFDMLLRNIYFLPWGKLGDITNQDLQICP